MLERHFTIVSKNDCPWCELAKDLLDELGHTYQELNISENSTHKQILVDNGFKTVPQIWEGPVHIGGYTNLKEYLNEAL